MANETGSSLSSPIEVLLAGNLADDDMTWAVRCPSTELPALVLSPVEWVAALGALSGWTLFGTGERAPVPVLTRDFCMNARPAEVPDPLGGIVVQGISGTNLLTLLVSPGAFEPLAERMGLGGGDDPFGPFWKEISSDPENPPSGRKPLPIIGALMAHFEILDRSETPEERALRTATYVLGVVLDPKGHAAMLSGLDHRWTVVSEGEPPAESLTFPPTEPRATYANVEAAAPGEGPEEEGGDDPEQICGTVFVPDPHGPPGSGTVTVKRWGSGSAT